MKLTKSLLGKQVRVRWRDPRASRVGSKFPDTLRDIPRGRMTLATWEEWGRIDDITEGVVHLRQGFATNPPMDQETTVEIVYSMFPEELVEEIVILQDQEIVK